MNTKSTTVKKLVCLLAMLPFTCLVLYIFVTPFILVFTSYGLNGLIKLILNFTLYVLSAVLFVFGLFNLMERL